MKSLAERNKGPRLAPSRAVRWAGSVHMLAALTGLHEQTVYKWIRRDYVPMGWRYWIIEQMLEGAGHKPGRALK